MQLPVCSSSLAQDDFPEQEALPPATQVLPPEDPELPPPEEDEPDDPPPEEEEPELPEPEEELEPEDDDELLELAGGGVGQEEQQVRVPPQPSEQE